jgi:hypothetical protein
MLYEGVSEADRVVCPRVRCSPWRYNKFWHGPQCDDMGF